MGIVAKACSALDVEPGLRRASGRQVVCARGRCSRAVRRSCVNLQGWNGRHSRWERLIGNVVPVQALLSAALGPSTITVDVSGNGHDVSQENG